MVRSIAPERFQHLRSSNLHQLHHSAGNDSIDVLKTISAQIRSQRRSLHIQHHNNNDNFNSTTHGMSDKIPKKYQFNKHWLELYMDDNVASFCGKITQIRIFIHAHSNPTYYILAQDGSEYVLRRRPPSKDFNKVLLDNEKADGKNDASAYLSHHAIEREYRVLKALYLNQDQCGIPVPRPYCLCLDSSVIGSPFFIMAFVRGRTFHNPMLWKLKSPQERSSVYRELSHYLAKLHSIDYKKILGLADFGMKASSNEQSQEDNKSKFYDRFINQWQNFYNRKYEQSCC